MKTAMQELIDKSDYSITFNGKYMIVLSKQEVTKLLEKEKEQIQNAFDLGRDEVTSVFIIDGEDYYNKSYNKL